MQPEHNESPLTYVEWYAGIGGWSMALHRALERMNQSAAPFCVAALDHSDLCQTVYQFNHDSRSWHPQVQASLEETNTVVPSEASTGDAPPTRDRKRRRGRHLCDHNDTGFSVKPIETCVAVKEKWNELCRADIWFLSPPCQPHTRQHSSDPEATRNDLADARSRSFLHLCSLLQSLADQKEQTDQAWPSILLLENVVGFESSSSCQIWRRALSSRNYHVAHFHLSPLQVSMPNDRPRYYTVAIRLMGEAEAHYNVENRELRNKYFRHERTEVELLQKPLIHVDLPELGVFPMDLVDILDNANDSESNIQPLDDPIDERPANVCAVGDRPTRRCPFPLKQFLDEHQPLSPKPLTRQMGAQNEHLRVPTSILQRNAAWCFDICTTQSRSTACFTSSYGKFVKGTGSVLYTGTLEGTESLSFLNRTKPEDRQFTANWDQGLNLHQHLRYFSGTEMCRLMGFPSSFAFPPSITLKQQWKLVGNSLNVEVAARLTELALRVWKS
jgi:tRNA (cytosine38-C5)-methyltransferase